MKQIKITVSKDGKVTSEAVGYTGPTCHQAVGKFSSLGEKKVEWDKPEFYLPTGQKTTTKTLG